jgi:hypothetical protein
MYDFELLIFILLFFIIIVFFLLVNSYFYNNIENFSSDPPKYKPFDLSNYATRPPIPEPEEIRMDYILANTQLLIPSTNDISNNNDNNSKLLPINPMLGVASQLSLLRKLKKDNDNIRKSTKETQDLLQSIQNKLFEITEDIKKKQNEKNKLSQEIYNMNINRYVNNENINIINKAMEHTIKKEQTLKKYETELLEKRNEIQKLLNLHIPEIPPVTIKKEQLKPITEKLAALEKKIVEINNKTPNNICSTYSEMPYPQKDAFLYDYNQVNNPSYAWCVCNDKNKHSESCINYMDCNKNYLKNKDKEGLLGEDLTLYMKCLSRYTNFPKYLNNKV